MPPDIRLLILPLPAFALLPFGAFLDKLRFSADDEDYSQQRYCSWTLAGLTLDPVPASSGAVVQVEAIAEQLDMAHYDYLVLFGGRNAMATAELAPRYKALLKRAAKAGVKLVAVDNAAFLLAACGLLDGHDVVVHWRHEAEFRATFPHLKVLRDQLYHIQGGRITCAGGTAAIDLVVELLSRACGRARALKGLADMLVDETRDSRHALRSLEPGVGHGRAVQRALALMRHHLGSPLSIEQLAAELCISRRQLDRQFQASHGMSAKAWWLEMRLQQARWRLLNSSHGLAQIADEVGLGDASHLGKCVRRRFGCTALQLREGAAVA
ncbi:MULTISPECIES: helix-turn-helix domain-containing protein [unclassified Pseudomonas]|uniref:GlxA family transcriptional regulator n=1 Tax=unclassified Pseudomonas TaxID=196821 RepID=UPI000A0A2113|nr:MULTISPECIES: helix-turn-helix domain-containing protein [unclassified Pseudomonas]SMF63524.1 transcriptional regulator, AraC family with amidase-like domain [Pseudomonas sp. LAIL14HWK12:I11]SMR80295.1 transcriptional regulator, AraC family with amidase-like domain [Pseudomonas sp. LAIL14HWK12:I10]SOD08116.1 transcriptional regulator, AraC family with amidase-like domain [Pseudomonas sp. LAIL14HWK12:I8]